MTGHDPDRNGNKESAPAGTEAAQDAEERALVASPLGRWRLPLAVAALVAIGVSVGLQWQGGRTDAPAQAAPAQGPQQRIAQIEGLLDAGRAAEARAAWRDFRQAYPDYPVPPALARRLEAPPATP